MAVRSTAIKTSRLVLFVFNLVFALHACPVD